MSGEDVGSEQSATDILSEQSGKRFIKYTVGVFAAVGLGYGVGLVLLDIIADDEAALVGMFAMFIPVLGAPIIAMGTGLLTGLRLDADDRSAALASGVGAFIGFIVLLILIVIFAAIALDTGNGNGDGDLSGLFGALLAFGTGVGVTAAATTFVVIRSKI